MLSVLVFRGSANSLQGSHLTYLILGLQDGSDTVCHGVDTLNTETQEVKAMVLKPFFFCLLWSSFFLLLKTLFCPVLLLGGTIYCKSDFTCFRWSWTHLSNNHESSGIILFFFFSKKLIDYMTSTLETLLHLGSRLAYLESCKLLSMNLQYAASRLLQCFACLNIYKMNQYLISKNKNQITQN